MTIPDNINVILATDCGSTTTKAILIEKVDGEYRLKVRGEAPTTVEAPFEDVTRGVINAIEEVEELSGRQILKEGEIQTPVDGDKGVDIYISTSSAGGGLQMMVSGVVKSMTAESAERAALGAGAIVMDVIASNDGRLPHERIERIRHLRPDMILLSGGIDGGTVKHVVELAELIEAAKPRPRLGSGYNLPVIYAGNKEAREEIEDTLANVTDLQIVDNLRPTLEQERLGPAREKIHDLFMEHVMAQAPGYKKLMNMTDAPIMPTPGAVGNLMQTIAEDENIDVVGVDIGGATTDVFSVFEDTFNRTVSANLGMSYSVANVLAETGLENILRWVPFDIESSDLRNRIVNKMIRPTTIPQTLVELKLEQAIAREALRLAFEQHKSFATSLKGVQRARDISDTFDQSMAGETLVDLESLDLIVGSGGVLSHAPRREQAMLMMIDAFLPEGVTELAVDSIFMMPQLGVLSTIHREAATQVFEKDCLIRLGTSVAPFGSMKKPKEAMKIELTLPSGETLSKTLNYGELSMHPMTFRETATGEVTPLNGLDLGKGKNNPVKVELHGGEAGLVFDARGRRPFGLSDKGEMRINKLNQWYSAMNIYPEE
ncbi:MAG: hypothetical protein MAGBODY4_01508 [Candidatus Marinimicrobia bacterium]|nr:hypothetical protein [Candidatus Neomarinimicrobiota bacterium]